ncbi:hypothetical protein WBP06_05960 [Novosphingobium sp. BL-8H]|uniref:hypothetical protein n=1 Tax=Novosphingobium sp. BL-8H TaxID=3127640 RepID=UPI00375758C3
MQRSLRILLFSLAAVIFGPIAFALMASVAPSSKRSGDPSDASRLLRTFDDAFPQIMLMKSDIDFVARECGYGTLGAILGDMPSFRSRTGWTSYKGYFYLSAGLNNVFAKRVEEERENQLNRRLANWEMKFLDRCISNSLFKNICGFRVRQALESGNLYDKYSPPSSVSHADDDIIKKTKCVFLDGVAARNGQKLSSISFGK